MLEISWKRTLKKYSRKNDEERTLEKKWYFCKIAKFKQDDKLLDAVKQSENGFIVLSNKK